MSNVDPMVTPAIPASTSPYSIASGEIGDQCLDHLRARWTARNMLWSSLPHEPRTGDLSSISLEAFLSHWREHSQHNWSHSDDRLTRLLKFASPTIEQLLENLRTSIRRSHNVRRPHQVRELDGRCMEWLGRQPGRHVREKIAVARGCLSVERIWTDELVENRVLVSLALRLAKLAECCSGGLDNNQLGELYAKAASWRTRLRREGLDHLRLTEPATPNNVLLSHRQYSIVWRAWERLRGFDDLYAHDLESDPSLDWCDVMIVALAAKLDQQPNIRMVHRVVRPPCVLRSGGVNSRLEIETEEIRFIQLRSDGIRDFVLHKCDQSNFAVSRRISSAPDKQIFRQCLRFDGLSVSISGDQRNWRPLGSDAAEVDRLACEFAGKIVGQKFEVPESAMELLGGSAIGCHLLGQRPIVLHDKLEKPRTLCLAPGVVEDRIEDDGSSVSYWFQSGKHLVDRETHRWLRLADLLEDAQADPVAFAPATQRLCELLQPSVEHVFAYGMPDSINEFRQSRLRTAMATSFRQPIPVWHSIALAEALQNDGAIQPNQDDVLVVVDLSGDRPCLTVLTRAEDAWEHHQPIYDEKGSVCGDRKLVHDALLNNPECCDIEKDLIDEVLSQRKDPPKPSLAQQKLESGMVLSGVVTRITDYCVFVDLGQRRIGRILVRDLADRYVKHPSDIVQENEQFLVKLLDVDHKKKRFGLAKLKLRDLTPGLLLEGIVTRVTHAGAFVDVGIGSDGLLHRSQLPLDFDKQSNETIQVSQKLRVKVVDVDLGNKRFNLAIYQDHVVLNRSLRLSGVSVLDLTAEAQHVKDCAFANKEVLEKSLDELCSSARLRHLVRSITNRRNLRSVSVVLASHCYPNRMHKQILQPVLSWAESLRCERQLPAIVKLRCFNDQIAIGCQQIAQRSLADEPTWYECLPPLAFEVVKDGHFHHCQLIDSERVRPHQTHRRVFRAVPGFTIPEGVAEPRLPLLTGEFGELPFGMEARLQHKALPLNEDCPCTLHLSYDYESESPYRLDFVPEGHRPGLSQLTAHWTQSEPSIRRAFPYPIGEQWTDEQIDSIRTNCRIFWNKDRKGEDAWTWFGDKRRRDFFSAIFRQSRSAKNLPEDVRDEIITVAREAIRFLEDQQTNRQLTVQISSIVSMILEDELGPPHFDQSVKRLLKQSTLDVAISCLGNGHKCRIGYVGILIDNACLAYRGDWKGNSVNPAMALARSLWRRPNAINLLDGNLKSATELILAIIAFLRNFAETDDPTKDTIRMLPATLELILAFCRQINAGGSISNLMNQGTTADEILGLVKRSDQKLVSMSVSVKTKVKFAGLPPASLQRMSPIAYNIVASLGGEQVGDLLEITDVG